MKLPFTWPNSSDSRSVSGRPAQLTATIGATRARAALMDGVRHELLADAALPGDEDLGVRPRDPVDFLRQLDDDGARPDQLFSSLASHSRTVLTGDVSPGPAIAVARGAPPPRSDRRVARSARALRTLLRSPFAQGTSSRLRRLRSSMVVNIAPRPLRGMPAGSRRCVSPARRSETRRRPDRTAIPQAPRPASAQRPPRATRRSG